MIIHKNPDAAVRAQLADFKKLCEGGYEEEFKKRYRKACREDFWFLCRVVMGYGYLDEDLHGKELLQFMADHKDKDQLRVLPRGHVKTRTACAEIVQDILNDPSIAILTVSATPDLVKGIGHLVGNTLLYNKRLRWAFADILPGSKTDCDKWGQFALSLPREVRKPRLEPTLMLMSMGKSCTGLHPDKIYLDDITGEKNNDEAGHREGTALIDQCLRLLPANGVFRWNATRWHDADPAGQAIDGTIIGKQGKFKHIIKSCFEDDDPHKAPIFPLKVRWNMDSPSGYSREQLVREMTVKSPQSRAFFSAQMRNNPVPEEEAIIQVKDIQIYKPEELPKFGLCRRVGFEVTGGGKVALNAVREKIQQYRIPIPIEEVSAPRQVGVSKADRIVSVLEPIVSDGRLYCQRWMIFPEHDRTECLGYELARLQAAKHDDIADALHTIPQHLTQGSYPRGDNTLAHLYLSVDPAWSEGKRNDFTVFIAVIVDTQNRYWVLDYERFQTESPSIFATKLISFFTKMNARAVGRVAGQGRRNNFAASYK